MTRPALVGFGEPGVNLIPNLILLIRPSCTHHIELLSRASSLAQLDPHLQRRKLSFYALCIAQNS